jgi:hypothetical protein
MELAAQLHLAPEARQARPIQRGGSYLRADVLDGDELAGATVPCLMNDAESAGSQLTQ